MGRRAGIPNSELLLRAEIARALTTAIGQKRGALSAAALSIGVTKQAMSLYLRQKATPGAEVLRRICRHWNLHLDIEGALVDASTLGERQPKKEPEQLSLFAALALVEDQRLNVSVLRKQDRSLDLKVTIHFDPPTGKLTPFVRSG